MRNLFRSFDRFGVEYLLISGQASILYGAATFSEDIDLWLRPTRPNIRKMALALASCKARVYKLTPPLDLRHFRKGHGFHFTLPGRTDPVYLDILGHPPRVGPFAAALRRATLMKSGWGTLPVVSIEDLIALKKTRRLYDYEVISNLVQIRMSDTETPSRKLLSWALRESYRAEDRAEFARRLGLRLPMAQIRRRISRDLEICQARDVAYWRPIIRDLRVLRHRGLLLPQGLPVGPLAMGSRDAATPTTAPRRS